jgi:NAD(P)-dependent dehydrogenase (short-subunit alcohol dehydrogenase family)
LYNYNMAPLAGQKIVIIGGSSGIGFSLAKAAMGEGAKVIIGSSNLDKAQAAAQRLGGTVNSVDAYRVDVTNEESVKTFYEHVGAFDHLVLTVCYNIFRRCGVH